MSQIKFNDFNLPAPLAQALADMGYETPTPVQAQAIPLALNGRDLLATAQTGTGKTAAFSIPLLTRMLNGDKRPALILAPTRELAEQTHKVLQQLTAKAPHLKSAVIIGGSSYHFQIRALRANPAFIVATPGRLIDQIQLGNLKLNGFGALILDEADRMLDMGFEPQLEEIVKSMPTERQTMLFSATLPTEILGMANRYMKKPERVAIGETSKPVERINQQVIPTAQSNKAETLIKEIDKVAGTLIVFTRTKSRTEAVAKILSNAGHEVARIHGDRSQAQRREAIEGFREGRYRILVATDIAARGIDVPHIRHVVNYDLPLVPEDYIHRIGRTARAGAEGNALAFVTPEDKALWGRIHKLMYGKFPEGTERPSRFGGRTGSRSGYVGKKTFNNPSRGGGKRSLGFKGERDENDFKPRAQKAFRPRAEGGDQAFGKSAGKPAHKSDRKSFGDSAESQELSRAQRRLAKFGAPTGVPAKKSEPSFDRAERPAKKSFGKKPGFEGGKRSFEKRGEGGFERGPRKSFGAGERDARRTTRDGDRPFKKSFDRKPAFDRNGDRPAGKPRFEKNGDPSPRRSAGFKRDGERPQGRKFDRTQGEGRTGGFSKAKPEGGKGRSSFGGRPAAKGGKARAGAPQKRGGFSGFLDRFRG